MVASIRNCFPVIYNTRYSYIFSLYGTSVNLTKLKVNILTKNGIKVVSVSKSPHYLCAIECLNSPELLELLPSIDKNRLIEFIDTRQLKCTNNYINYIKDFHPETDAVETLLGFLALMNIFSTECVAIKKEISVLVRRRKDLNGYRFWLLLDGLHRSSILLALNKLTVNARVVFP